METIYGIDVSKNHLDVYGVDRDGQEFQKQIKNNLKCIEHFLFSIEKEAIVCAEFTGVYGDLLVVCCYHISIKIAMANGYTLRHSMGNAKGKSDKIDAVRIWEYAHRFIDKLDFVEPDNEVMTELKELYNLRNQLVKQRKMILTSQTGKLNAIAGSLYANRVTVQILEQLNNHVNSLEDEILNVIYSSDIRTNMELITTVIGVGKITALELIIATGNFKKLPTSKKAAAYAGVCPYPNESGNKTRKSKVHPRSNKKLKSILYMASLSACQWNKEYRLYRTRKLAEGKQFFLVMNNVANKLLRTIYAIIESGEPFDFNYLPQDPRTMQITESIS